MKRIILLIALFLTFNGAYASPLPLYQFIKNEGQWSKDIKFRASIPGGYLLVKENSIQYLFINIQHGTSQVVTEARIAPKTMNGHLMEMEFLGGNQTKNFQAQDESSNIYNFFEGSDPSKWKSNVKAYNEILIKDVYPDIDFRLYSIDQSLKYEYIVAPSANVSHIKMKYAGMSQLKLADQQLHFETSVNTFKEFNPFSFQVENGRKKEVSSDFKLENSVVSFNVSQNYDKSQALIIDPELVFSTYSGSSSDNWSHTATYDSEGNLYAGGSVFGANFPVTLGAFQTQVVGAQSISNKPLLTDVVISKYASNGSKLLYSTFLGGNGSEVPHSLIVNSKDELVVFGTTSSDNFPLSKNAFQKTFNGGTELSGDPITTSIAFEKGTDIFVSVLSKDGTNLIGSTYIGGSSNDGINDTRGFDIRNYGDEFRGEVYVDVNDNIFVGSVSSSGNFPVVKSTATKKSVYDAVIFSLNRSCENLLWSTFFGGDNYDAITGIRVTYDGSVYVCGLTSSKDLPVKTGALNSKLDGQTDGFVAKFKDFALEQVSYIGTSKADNALLIDIDKESNIYLLGLTTGDYPVSSGVYRNANSGQFIHVLDAKLSKTILSTTFGASRGGGKIEIVPTAFLVNDCGNIYISGWGGNVNLNTGLNSYSTTKGLPITDDAFQKTTSGSNYYFIILESGAKSLLYATYFGSAAPADATKERGDHLDGGTCRFDKHGIIYHSACVCKADGFAAFPMKNAVSNIHGSTNCNMAAFKFNIDAIRADFELTDGVTRGITEACSPAKITFDNMSVGARTYEWQLNNELLSRVKDVSYNFTKPGEYVVKLKIFNKITCSTVDSTTRKIKITGFENKISKDTSICSSKSVQLFAEGGTTFLWIPSAGLNNQNIANPIASPKTTTKYTVKISEGKCAIERDVTVKVDDSKPDFTTTESKEICKGQSIELKASGLADSYIWSAQGQLDSTKNSIMVKPTQTTTYNVKALYSDGCQPRKAITIIVDTAFQPKFDSKIEFDCSEPYKLSFENVSPSTGNLVWEMGDGNTLKVPKPENYHYVKAGKYNVVLKASNANGCTLQTSKEIVVPEPINSIPNVITPNNDGKNDTFKIGLDADELKIYTRWGKLLYENKDYNDDWGNEVEAGTYYYSVKIPTGKECKGWVNVIK